jgi:hypothetical protein
VGWEIVHKYRDASISGAKGRESRLSNRGFAEWGEVFGDPMVAIALLDRLLHQAVVIQIEGSSYWLRRHADLMPEHVRSRASIIRQSRHSRRAAAVGRPKKRVKITIKPADHEHPSNWRILLRHIWGNLSRH